MTNTAATQLDRLFEVPGHLGEVDARVFIALLRAQREAGVAGDILEIGAWFGRSSILLGYLRAPGEKLVVNDLFEAPPATDSGRREVAMACITPTRSAFERHYLQFHQTLPETIQRPSSELPDVLRKDQRFRFIHVDGSHTFEAVSSDIQLAQRIAAAGGIVAFDDYANTGHPAVAAALWPSFVTDGLEPFAATGSKLYVSNAPELAARYRDVVESVAVERAWEVLHTPIGGWKLVTVRDRAPSRQLHSRVKRRLRRIEAKVRRSVAAAPTAAQAGSI